MTSPTAERTRRRLPVRLLTPREHHALLLYAAGHPTKAIARSLNSSPEATRLLLHRALRKLGARTRAEAAAGLAPAPSGTAPTAAPPAPAPAPAPATLTELITAAHARLVQQTYLVTARRRRAARSVRRALGEAGRHWPTVAATEDPEAWVRAYAFDHALSPWRTGTGPRRAHRFHLPHRRIRLRPAQLTPEQLTPQQPMSHQSTSQQPTADQPGTERHRPTRPARLSAQDKALLKALRRLPRPQRRALVLHDALGLPAGAVAAEVESSTPAAEGRVRSARAALAAAVPELVGGDPAAPGFAEALSARLHRAAVRGCPAPRRPAAWRVRWVARLQSGAVTGAAAALVLAMGGTMVATLAGNGPSSYFHPQAAPPPLCVTTGSAGPARPTGTPGLHTPWCNPFPGAQPARAAQPAAIPASLPSPPAAPAAPEAEPPPAQPARPRDFLQPHRPAAVVDCAPLRLCSR
ncbi:Putative LuxR family transcriptional regulator [Kitasatospora sp. MMS16-BH015]|uniref:response regulator transcription factor n=1 Tax=Kitasatospora sp. MMS16-BH015 TaxID=2018025 RepID=UPI000CA20334|nr:helix-turn-helix transcriptional regulator [Kitasatospora sp. MMS16-BH015]AUG77684.1 Putative LuxR family transcriptional regulator [Kitasatospora sp. MMS16-BH015]